MKILLVQDYLRSGGTERQTVLLANAFSAAGHRVHVITFRPGGPLDPTLAPGVTRHALQPFDLGLDWFAPGLIARARRIDPDVTLCHGRMANCRAAGLQAALPGRAVIATMRTGKPLPFLFRRSLHRVRHVVANSEEARETLLRDGITPARVSVIRNALVFPAAAPAPERRGAIRDRLGAGPGATVLLCVAMFRREKNQRELIEIVRGLPPSADWMLWLAGDGPERAACERLAAAHGLAGRVCFLGFQANPSEYYAAADLAVHASWSEALSNFLIEAQAHGLPFVAYEAQGIRECGLPGVTGWPIPRDDRSAFQAAVMRWHELPPAAREDVSARARTFAREAFDPQRQVDVYLRLFATLRAAAS